MQGDGPGGARPATSVTAGPDPSRSERDGSGLLAAYRAAAGERAARLTALRVEVLRLRSHLEERAREGERGAARLRAVEGRLTGAHARVQELERALGGLRREVEDCRVRELDARRERDRAALRAASLEAAEERATSAEAALARLRGRRSVRWGLAVADRAGRARRRLVS